MDDLAAWLTQIWDEDETEEHGKYRTVVQVHNGSTMPDEDGLQIQVVEGGPVRYVTREEYLAEFCEPDPDPFVLARIAADRQILALHDNAGRGQVLTTSGFQGIRATCTRCGVSDEYGVPWPCKTVRLLALPHADRPGYQESWRP